MTTHRRAFLKHAATGTAAVALAASYARTEGANDRLTVGVIGPGGMGSNHLRALVQRKDVRVAWLCDVDSKRLADAAKIVEPTGTPAKTTKDMREILGQKD